MKRGMHILVVDDESILRRSIKKLLEHVGHEVSEADCGEAALEQFARRSFDLVITDFSMPGMHGDQLVARIRQLVPAQPIIMATAFADDYEVFCQAGGNVDAMLLKPFTFQALLDVIDDVLAQHELDQPSVTMTDPQRQLPQDSYTPAKS